MNEGTPDNSKTQLTAQPTLARRNASPAAQAKAVKLRSVLEPFLRGRKLDVRSQAELEAAGAAAYLQVFGHPISGRWFRTLFTRALERGGEGDRGCHSYH